jgi:hypothetical protein
MLTVSFLNTQSALPERRPGRRRVMLGLLLAGGALGWYASLTGHAARVPKPGPRRYGPGYRHRPSVNDP